MNNQMNHHTAMVDDIRIHYLLQGEGLPVVLLHGWPGFWYSWRKQIPVLAEKFQVIVPDLRGSGNSDKPAWGYDGRTLASDVHGLVQSLGHSRVALVAFSVGVRVAYRYCLDYEGEVDRVVLIDTPHPLAPGGTAAMVSPFTVEQARARWHNFFHIIPELPERLVEGHEEYYLRFLYHAWSGNKDILTDEELAEYVRNYRQPGALRGGFNLYRASAFLEMADWRADEDRQLSMPMFFIGAGEDKKYGDQSGHPHVELWRKVFTNVQETIYKGCGHFPNEEMPEKTNQDLLAFLGESGQ